MPLSIRLYITFVHVTACQRKFIPPRQVQSRQPNSRRRDPARRATKSGTSVAERLETSNITSKRIASRSCAVLRLCVSHRRTSAVGVRARARVRLNLINNFHRKLGVNFSNRTGRSFRAWFSRDEHRRGETCCVGKLANAIPPCGRETFLVYGL